MEFVTFEIAKKLKEKGFDWETSNMYERNTLVCIYEDYPKPTISQVLKWMREEKKMHIIIPASLNEKYWWEIRDFNKEISEYSNNEYTSYEEAAIVAIEYTLNNLI